MKRLLAVLLLLPSLAFGQGVALGKTARQPVAFTAIWSQKPAASEPVRIPLTVAVTFASAFGGSYCSVGTNATATATFTIEVTGSVSCSGSVAIATNGTCTFTLASPCNAAKGDALVITAPASPDSTLAGFGFSIAGTR